MVLTPISFGYLIFYWNWWLSSAKKYFQDFESCGECVWNSCKPIPNLQRSNSSKLPQCCEISQSSDLLAQLHLEELQQQRRVLQPEHRSQSPRWKGRFGNSRKALQPIIPEQALRKQGRDLGSKRAKESDRTRDDHGWPCSMAISICVSLQVNFRFSWIYWRWRKLCPIFLSSGYLIFQAQSYK